MPANQITCISHMPLKDFVLTRKMQLPGFFLLHQLSVISILPHDQTVFPLLAATTVLSQTN
jgi:hypothetical protein